MSSMKRVLVAAAATAALVLSLTACGGAGSGEKGSTKPTKSSVAQTDRDKEIERELSRKASVAALLKDHGWILDPNHATACVETTQYSGWNALCAVRVIPEGTKGCLQTWVVQFQGNQATRFALLAGRSNKVGADNPKAGSVMPPACDDR